jgi:hypothetical protein
MEETSGPDISVFQTKYNEFVEDLLGALPEYTSQIQAARELDMVTRLNRFQEEVKVGNTFGGDTDDFNKNPEFVLPGVKISDSVWQSLSDNTQKAIWEYVRILSICCFMEAGFSEGSKPAWMDEAMNDMKTKLESADFQNIIKKFMTFLKPSDNSNTDADNKETSGSIPAGFEKLFENGFPKIPEKFLKGHMAKLAQEIVKDITPQDLGISEEMVAECEKNPSRAFDILFQVFGNNPGVIQKTIQKIGKRLQQKIMSGAIRPQEIAREAEELMKEFASNSSFVEMMDGIKSAFGFEDINLARQAGKESSARLSLARERLRKKASEKEARKSGLSTNLVSGSSSSMADADAIAEALMNEEANTNKKSINTKTTKKSK